MDEEGRKGDRGKCLYGGDNQGRERGRDAGEEERMVKGREKDRKEE